MSPAIITTTAIGTEVSGAVQYFLWKAMLDIGEGQFAFDIAHRGLNSWKQEIEFSYNTFEMIQIETERGGWFHQF